MARPRLESEVARLKLSSASLSLAEATCKTQDLSPSRSLHREHLQDWLDSAVHRDIINLNVKSLSGTEPYEYLLYAEGIKRTSTGRLASQYLNSYKHVEAGGWRCSGLDPDSWGEMLWGCFKADSPRRSSDGKLIKYEHPPKVPTRAFFLRVTLPVWQRIAQRYSVAMPEDIVVTATGEAIGFWLWVLNHPEIPICVVEGAKKAGAILSAGYVSVAIPGICNGYRVSKDENNNPVGNPALIPDLALFANAGREIYICFDKDSKPKTIKAVNGAIAKTGGLFESKGCTVKVISWQEAEKGVDDLILNCDPAAFDCAYQEAATLDSWKARGYTQLTYPAAVTLNQRYIGKLAMPDDAKLVGIKSPKGTGKTQAIEDVVSEAVRNGQWVLVIGHRVQLTQALCQRFGINYITEVRGSETGSLLGYGLCIDSLHSQSQARFKADNWHDGIVILDEAEQVIWHALNSSTCQSDRISILRELKALLGNVLQGDGRVFLSDADLSDVSLDYVRSLAGVDVTPWIVVNDWKPGTNERWDVHHYTGANPSKLVAELEKHIAQGGRPFLCCSAQKVKSKWGTRNLEAHFKALFPDKRILRIDSETISDPSHPAFGAVADLNQLLGGYDIVLCSPSIETGVSIDIKGCFSSCWGIFQGVQSGTSARQALARLREPVVRHLWAASHGVGQIGNGSTSVKSLLASQQKLAKANIHLLQNIATENLELGFQPESLHTWARMAVRVNFGMNRYRQAIIEGLVAEGHNVIDVGAVSDDQLKQSITASQQALQQSEAVAITSATDITPNEFEKLQAQRSKTQDERYQERKYSLKKRYSVEVTSDLVLKDDNGWYPQLRLHYYCTVGRAYLPKRDGQRASNLSDSGSGAVFLPDFNKRLLSVSVGFILKLGILDLLDGREVTGSDEQLQQLATMAQANSWEIKAALNVSISDKDKPIAIAQKLLAKLGVKLSYLGKRGARGQQQRVYRYLPPGDGRDKVFDSWLSRDLASAANPVVTSSPVSTLSNRSIDTQGVDTDNAVVTPSNKEVTTQRVDTIAQVVTPSVSTPQTSIARRAVEVLISVGEWLGGYFYVGRRGNQHQLCDLSGYDKTIRNSRLFAIRN